MLAWLVWYFFLYDSIWQVVQIGICPWTLRMPPGCLWKFESVVPSFMSPSPRSLSPASQFPGSSGEEPFPWCRASPMLLLALFAKFSSFCMFQYQFKCLFAQTHCLSHRSKAHSVPSGLTVKQQSLTVSGHGRRLHKDRLTARWSLGAFPFPKARSKASPRAGSHLSSRLL